MGVRGGADAHRTYNGLCVGVDPGLLLTVYLVTVSEPDRMAG